MLSLHYYCNFTTLFAQFQGRKAETQSSYVMFLSSLNLSMIYIRAQTVPKFLLIFVHILVVQSFGGKPIKMSDSHMKQGSTKFQVKF